MVICLQCLKLLTAGRSFDDTNVLDRRKYRGLRFIRPQVRRRPVKHPSAVRLCVEPYWSAACPRHRRCKRNGVRGASPGPTTRTARIRNAACGAIRVAVVDHRRDLNHVTDRAYGYLIGKESTSPRSRTSTARGSHSIGEIAGTRAVVIMTALCKRRSPRTVLEVHGIVYHKSD